MSNPTLNYTNFSASTQLTKDNASFAFGVPMGAEWDLGYQDTTWASRSLGMMRFDTMLTVGNTEGGFEAPINKAARSLYTKYWAKNSSLSSFQPQDVTIYTYATAQCVALVSWLNTIYGVRNYANANSQYTKTALYAALGVNATDITQHLTDLRGYINNKIIDLKNIRLDATIPLYKYANEMYSHIYMDSPNTSKTQLYITRPNYVLKYVRTGENIGSLQYEKLFASNSTLLTYEQITSFVDDIFAACFNSAYIAQISAAIGKAETQFYAVAETTEAYNVTPYFDARALMRFKNASVRRIRSLSMISQDVANQTVKSQIRVHTTPALASVAAQNAARSVYECKQFLHSWNTAMQKPEETIVTASFMTSLGDWIKEDGANVFYYNLDAYGFEILTDMAIISRLANGFGVTYNDAWDITTTAPTALSALRAAAVAKEFDFGPTLHIAQVSASGVDLAATLVDTDDYYIATARDVRKIHRSAIYAILGVPAEG